MSVPANIVVHTENVVASCSQAEELISPVTTDSMVTVPLSDRYSRSESILTESGNPATPFEMNEDQASVMDVANQTSPTPTPEASAADDAFATEEMQSTSQSVVKEAGASQEGYESSSSSSENTGGVDWEKLDRSEEQEPRTEGTDESTALLLARLEQENNALATNPKSGLAKKTQRRSRPPSIQHLQKLVNDPRASLRYSQLEIPAMTELEFWAALVADYPTTAQRLPTLTSHKIRAGIPPPLRGVVWASIAGARDTMLIEEFGRLCGESSPYEGLIGKDIGRSFPNVEMFRNPNGEGQQMLARVLKCFSLYDTKIGYCQGLGFVVGPLLMHMTDAESFCVLIRLMEHYDLRSCFLPDLSGLHLRIYQFQTLLSRSLPNLFAHLQSLNIEPIYVSQWFLSFFAVTCPLPMLLRIYDVLLLEGASETLMRVALSLMQRNEKRIMEFTEFEDVLQFLLSPKLWDTYACNADDLVNDFVSLTHLVSRESLRALEATYNQSQGVPTGISFPQIQATASRFLGRLWSGSHKSLNLPAGRPESIVRRSPSKQSMASTLNSMESSVSETSTAPTEMSLAADQKTRAKSAITHRDRDLHGQIEDLLTALSDMQREQTELARELQREREDREEDREISRALLSHVKQSGAAEDAEELMNKAEERFLSANDRPNSIVQTKHQLKEELCRWKAKHEIETARCSDLTRQLDDHETENARLKEELREARSRIQDGYRERQKLERTVQDLRTRKGAVGVDSNGQDISGPASDSESWPVPSNGLREFKLGRSKTDVTRFPKRSSSLGLQSLVGSGPPPAPASEPEKSTSASTSSDDSLLLELVNAKTAEAVAKQELEEVKAKLDSLRKLMNGHARVKTSPGDTLANFSTQHKLSPEPTKAVPATGGGFFGWGRRSASTAGVTEK